ncbi:DUF6328 family protein [Streptomyces thermolineatus]|uniref:DUF6328 family protein n=1 Tax=Streptomyces thermolineatus TaxID=44033 RepID=A0ABP5Y2A3_9ACTN
MNEDGAHIHDEDSSRPSGDEETLQERTNRRWVELLQEVRVAQTGVQILLGFLLTVAFTPRFPELSPLDHQLYVVTVVLGAAATGALIAPVSFHRLLAGQKMKPELVQAASKLVMIGITLLALTIVSALLLLLRVATGNTVAHWTVLGVTAWFAVCWFVIPARMRSKAERRRERRREESGRGKQSS